MGHFIGLIAILFSGSFLIGTVVMTVKELIARKRANSGDLKKSNGEEDDSGN